MGNFSTVTYLLSCISISVTTTVKLSTLKLSGLKPQLFYYILHIQNPHKVPSGKKIGNTHTLTHIYIHAHTHSVLIFIVGVSLFYSVTCSITFYIFCVVVRGTLYTRGKMTLENL